MNRFGSITKIYDIDVKIDSKCAFTLTLDQYLFINTMNEEQQKEFLKILAEYKLFFIKNGIEV